MVRSKMQLIEITDTLWGAKRLKFLAIYDPSIPEDQKFQTATPTASAEYLIDNPEALAQFTLGGYYYVDFSLVAVKVETNA